MADDNHDDGGDDRDEDAEILEINIVDDPEEGTLGVAVLQSGHA